MKILVRLLALVIMEYANQQT